MWRSIFILSIEAEESAFQYFYTEISQDAHLADRLGWYTVWLS